MGLLLSVLIGCFGVLELLACLRHATSGVPLADEKSPPCLFYHHFDSANFSSHDCICNISHSSQTSFPTSVKQKLENLHEYSLRVRNDLRSLGDHYEWTLSDFSTRDLFGASRPDSRLGDDFADETSDVKTKSGLKMRNEVFLPSEFNSYEMSLTPISFKLENCKLSSYSFNKNVEMSSINDSENQTLKNLFLEYKDSERYFHYAKSYQNSPGISNNERKNVSKCPSKIDSSRWADDMFPKKNQKKTSKNTAKLICINAKKYLDEDRGPSDVAIQTSSDLLEDKYSKNEYSSSNRKSVPVQTSFEEKISEDDTLHGLKSNLNFKNSAGRIHGNENVSFWKIESNELSSFRKKSSVNNGKSRKCENLFDCGIQDKKELNSELKKSANNWEDLTTNGKVFNNSEPFDKYMDAKGEDIMTLERRITSPIKYAVPDAGENHAFWLIFSDEYTKAMNKDWHSGHFCCWQCDESLTGQRYVLRDEHPYCIKCYESVFANGCEECSKIIGIDSKDLSYKDKHWHEACFLCNKCRVSLVDKQFGSKVDKIYCGNCYDAQFASRCDGCGEIFRAGTKKMEYKTRQWHEKCFCCFVCKNPIGTKSFIPREQEIYCAGCYEDKFATRCVKCNKIITAGGVTYKNEPWHRDCFTCSHCNNSLAGQRFTSRDEKPYCAECFGELFAKRCTACSKPITGIGGTRFISFEDRHWHNDCFICAGCKTSLVGRGFITDGDDVICPECAKQKLM